MLSVKKISKIPLSFFTAAQVAEILDCTPATVYNYMKRGVRVTNDIYIRLERKDSSKITKDALISFREQIDQN